MTELDLTDPQKFLVGAHGSLFVEACPGAGKTKAIVARYVRRVAEEQRRGIALVSFTKTAIDEVTDRCRDQPDSLVVPHFVGTIDAFINRFIVTPLYTRDYRRRVRFIESCLVLAKTPSDDGGVDAACEKLGITQAWLSDVVVRMALTLSSHTGDIADYTKRIRTFLAGLAWPTTPPREFGSLRTPNADQWTGLGLGDMSSGLNWSTVHGAKGRQMSAVGMVIPKNLHCDEDDLTALDHWEYRTSSEAKRVLYVGVSRAERLLMLAVHKNHRDRVAGILARDNVPYH
ncbi:UvrD-helicase domain-containing protein [Nonomuraea sp. NPDC052265]|uniref:UvrD-helicase domain-containing protein n=1 Tax=Nonomuraea sp. NPDC052265 TaxID=3364374 RepID=UPI0037C7FD3B